MLNSIMEIDRKGLFWTPREPMSPSGNRTGVLRYARACPRPHGRLMLTVLGGLAEFERELIIPTQARAASVPRSAACASDGRVSSHAQITASLSLLREPRIRPAGLPRAFAGSVSRLLERLSGGLRPSARGVARPNLA